jgi:hypothetical protein
MPIAPLAYAHVRLTVTDIDRSRAFYDQFSDFRSSTRSRQTPTKQPVNSLRSCTAG